MELKIIQGFATCIRSEIKKPMDENKNAVVPPETELDPIAAKDVEIAKLKDDLKNYRNVALKRLGKLPGDAEFMGGQGTEISVEEQVKMALLDHEITRAQQDKETEIRRMAKENAELKLALKNRPGQSISGGSGEGSSVEVKDNVFTEAQLADLRARATRLKSDPEKFIEQAKKNLNSRR